MDYDWRRRFAWMPTRTGDGWVWLSHYERRRGWYRPETFRRKILD